MHRRSLIDRTRYIYEIDTCMINNHYFLMKLVTSAGSYVKEFVHGDMGRTRPSLSSWFDSEVSMGSAIVGVCHGVFVYINVVAFTVSVVMI
jgi:tRNA U54 and U55 pseudouridine synthase Pus10